VLGKRVVVQHLWLGGLIEWDLEGDGARGREPTPIATTAPTAVATSAPWVPTPTPAPWNVLSRPGVAQSGSNSLQSFPERVHRSMGPPPPSAPRS
jgi:hypothetical protein